MTRSNPFPPRRGAYFRVTKEIDKLEVGELLLAWTDEDGDIHAMRGEQAFYYDAGTFAAHFEPAPAGRAERMAQLERLLAQANAEESVEPAGLLAEASEVVSGGQALVSTKKRNEIVEAKRAALQARKKVELLKTELKGILAEQEKVLELAAAKWGAQLEKLTYAIESINLYLGRDEHFTSIQEGQPAPAREPIVIRQTVLFMDEECALHADEGGIDFKSIEDFDRWLCEPRHLQQVLPESKGIVAMRLRRGDKFYAHAAMWEQIMFSQANGGTYILVRNGTKLWRVWNNLELPGHLFPTKAEFENLFHDKWSEEPLQPGSLRYQKALNEAQGLRKLYLQAALLLQGIVDRTRVFHPLAVERVNLFDPNPDSSILRLIRDAENLLGTGRPPYQEWRRQLNDRLEVGKRVVFGGTSYQRYQYEDRKDGYSRTVPKFVEWPDREAVYTLTNVSSEDGDFQFQFQREGVKRRATFNVRKHDEFILNFDDAKEDDIEFYLSDRGNRHHYLSSFPLLKAALRLKQEEREREKPFVELLARHAADQCKISESEARQRLSVIIPWWKQKNRFSRNLTTAEKAAYKQILQEVRLRLAIRANNADAESVARIHTARTDWLVIAKDTGYTVTCLRRVPGILGLVTRETWSTDGQNLKTSFDCYMPSSETGRWEVLAARSEWADWPKHGRREEFLSEPEYQQLLAEARDAILRQQQEGGWNTFVAVTASNEALYIHGVRTRDYFWGNRKSEPEWVLKQAKWRRVKGIAHLEPCGHWPTLSSILRLDQADESPNQIEQTRHTPEYEKARLAALSPELRELPFTVYGHRLLWLDKTALDESRKLLFKVATRQRRRNRRWSLVRFYEKHIEEILKERFWEHEKRKYLGDGGVVELWEDHAKTVRYHPMDLNKTDLESCLNCIVTAGINVAEHQSGEIWSLAQAHGWKPNNPEANRSVPTNIPLPEPPADLD
ncbi:MAG: hypothetical protein ABS95_00195 [Verrucomicrobia bacterium SCN 57-15]|nr:MAG: hypothetical protein ABS95_00195 [Verrucomicrobia bacterium SCN 57-15]